MRLVCPNCDAEYEVEDAAIPRTGRDVQCSNCGHAWFQSHPEMADEFAEDLADDLTPLAGPDRPAVEDVASQAVGEQADPAVLERAVRAATPFESAPEGLAAARGPARTLAGAAPGEPAARPVTQTSAEVGATRNIDESVLAVLREEADREVAARRAETPAPVLETQTEMRLAPAASVTPAVVDRELGEPEMKPAGRAAVQAARPRRDLLPTIEEINSTLRASSGRPGEEDSSLVVAEAAQAARNRFGSGFITLVLLAVILLALYILAPLIAEKVPALDGVAVAYVAAIDAARIWLDGQIKSLIGMLRGFEGTAQG